MRNANRNNIQMCTCQLGVHCHGSEKHGISVKTSQKQLNLKKSVSFLFRLCVPFTNEKTDCEVDIFLIITIESNKASATYSATLMANSKCGFANTKIQIDTI